MTALHDLTVAALAAKLGAKEVSAVELAQHFLARAKSHGCPGDGGAHSHDCAAMQGGARKFGAQDDG